MNTSRDWERLIRRMELLMRLKSFPVAFRLLEDKQALSEIPFLRRPAHKSTLCQLINLVRSFDWTVGADLDDFLGVNCPSVIGLTDIPEFMKNGTFRSVVWTKTREDGKKYEASIPRLPVGRYQAVAMGPLVYNPFDPDIVLIYANPAQMMLLINSLQFEDYQVMEFFCVGETSCADAIARCYLNKKPSLTIPCYGERRYGHTQDDELVMAVPAGTMEKALSGMEALYRRGIRYPISFAGTETDLAHAFPAAYSSAPAMEAIRGKGANLLLGVTGGVASGKSTVVEMLRELGAPLIDFDVLTRKVQQPGEPAYHDIVSYFGDQVLLEDGTLDRNRLSEIVFGDLEKRKKLESFTHPRIGAEFVKMVREYSEDDADTIIQVAVPLLIEANMQYMFDKILVVYASEEEQVRRLMARDGIGADRASGIVASQLSIEEKRGYADLVIDNSGTLEDTRKQVQGLWETLKDLQRQKASGALA